jgi:hypothetical protein
LKYQAIQHLKTKTKLLGLYDTLKEAIGIIESRGGIFDGISYIGSFPIYKDPQSHIYSVQGFVEHWQLVCSLPDAEVEMLRANK